MHFLLGFCLLPGWEPKDLVIFVVVPQGLTWLETLPHSLFPHL